MCRFCNRTEQAFQSMYLTYIIRMVSMMRRMLRPLRAPSAIGYMLLLFAIAIDKSALPLLQSNRKSISMIVFLLFEWSLMLRRKLRPLRAP
jgi:hypothetical protein